MFAHVRRTNTNEKVQAHSKNMWGHSSSTQQSIHMEVWVSVFVWTCLFRLLSYYHGSRVRDPFVTQSNSWYKHKPDGWNSVWTTTVSFSFLPDFDWFVHTCWTFWLIVDNNGATIMEPAETAVIFILLLFQVVSLLERPDDWGQCS